MKLDQYGSGANGPGHCFHQHLTFYLRAAGDGVPPASAYPDYVLGWADLWSAIDARRQIFDAAAEHFARYTEATNCFEQRGLLIRRVPFQPDHLSAEIVATHARRSLLLAAVDTFYLPSFVEHMHVHGLTMVALLDVTADGSIDMWHWENSSLVPIDRLVRAISEQGSKLWQLDLDPAHQPAADALVERARQALATLQPVSTATIDGYTARLAAMYQQDPPAPLDAATQAILFHVPYRLLADGSFRTLWLVRSAANRIMHARGAQVELLNWTLQSRPDEQTMELAQLAQAAFLKWKTLNILCARFEMRAPATLPAPIVQQLTASLEADQQLASASLAHKTTSHKE